VSLLDLANDEQQQNDLPVPLFLVKTLRHIEDKAAAGGEDLYDAYRLSADTARLETARTLINETGIALIDLGQFDLNTLCSLLKSFLRDLQNTVIPEEVYAKLVSSIRATSSEELRSLIHSNLDPVHMACLRHIMQHLIRVWTHQVRVRGCHFLPDKLFHIFRGVLMRPHWSRILDCVHDVDAQSLCVQRLMLECDWGVELPEYKVRPKRPANPSLDSAIAIESDSSPWHRERSPAVIAVSRSEPMAVVTAAGGGGGGGGSNRSSPSSVRHQQQQQQQLLQRRGSYNRENLVDMQWYWAAIDRDETMLILKNCPDGSFVVRDSSERTVNPNNPSPYTLCVMKGN
jgi:hypothetical protein